MTQRSEGNLGEEKQELCLQTNSWARLDQCLATWLPLGKEPILGAGLGKRATSLLFKKLFDNLFLNLFLLCLNLGGGAIPKPILHKTVKPIL